MKILIDTSVLFPALDPKHAKHAESLRLLKKLESENALVVLNTHLIAELFNNLSRQPRLPIPLEKVREILRHLSDRYERVTLTTEDYLKAIDRCVNNGLRGGVIYDALHFQAAVKAEVNVLYTANLRDFRRLMTDEIRFELKSPY